MGGLALLPTPCPKRRPPTVAAVAESRSSLPGACFVGKAHAPEGGKLIQVGLLVAKFGDHDVARGAAPPPNAPSLLNDVAP